MLAWIAGAIILFGCAVPIAIDVVSRFFLNRTLVESFEISGYGLAACIGLGMGYTVTTKANIRVDFVVAKLPVRFRAAFDLLAALALAVVAVALAYFAWSKLQQSWTLNAKSISTLQVPLYVPQGIWWVGSVLVRLRCRIVAGTRRRPPRARRPRRPSTKPWPRRPCRTK